MLSKLKKHYLLVIILVLAALLRFWQLGQVPPSPDWDEAALGYNAYSIMKTGRDEYGKFLPLILRSFDDYKPAIYAYFIIPFIKLVGLNTLAVRLPAAIFGTLACLVVYFLVKELFGQKKLALLTAFLLAVSPWHLQFSRIAFETNVGLFFDMLIVFLMLRSLKKPQLLFLSAFFAGANLYIYQAQKVFTPLLVLAVFFPWRKKFLSLPRRYLAGAVFLGFLLTLPFIYLTLTTPEIFLRAKGTSITADQTPFLARTVEKLIRDKKAGDFLGLVLDNRRVTYAKAFIGGWLSHFDLNWLFITGDEARHHAPGIGLLYLWEFPFLLLGVYSLIFTAVARRAKLLSFAWLFLAPMPASFSTGTPHAVRTIRMMPIPQLLVAFGILKTWNFLKDKGWWGRIFLGGWFLFAFFNFFYFLNQYFVQQNYFYSASWQYGYRQAVEEVEKIEQNYEKIVVSNEPHLDQSYMFFLFYLKYNPATYQALGGTVSGGFAEEHRSFEKYVFQPINWGEEEKSGRILYVGRPNDFPEGVKVIKTIYFLDGQPAIKIVQGG